MVPLYAPSTLSAAVEEGVGLLFVRGAGCGPFAALELAGAGGLQLAVHVEVWGDGAWWHVGFLARWTSLSITLSFLYLLCAGVYCMLSFSLYCPGVMI